MDNGGYLDMCRHGIIGVITCAVQMGIIRPKPEISGGYQPSALRFGLSKQLPY